MKKTFTLSSNKIILLLTLYYIIILNIGYWSNFFSILQQTSLNNNILLIITMPIFLIAAMNVILHVLFYPYLHKVIMPIILILGSAASYAVMTQGIYFNDDQIINIVQTNPGEAGAWINIKFILWVIFTGIIPALFYILCIRLKPATTWYKGIAWRLFSVAISLVVIGAIALLAYQHYASFFRNNKAIVHKIIPTNYLGASIKVTYNHYESTRPFEAIGLDAKRTTPQGEKKNLLVFVLGETTRAQNWGLNPNAPATTPQLAQRQDIINFSNVSSCGTSTAISVPCMFSNMTRKEYDARISRHQEGVLDILNRAGLYVSWRENDGGCKGVCDRVKNIKITTIADPKKCIKGLCYDDTLLTGLVEEIRTMPNDGIIILHTAGSHGPAYYERYPDSLKKFTPTCDTNQLQDCSYEQLTNTYNNTVVAVDDMLSKTIQLLEGSDLNVGLIYVSDHGESLGENGLYLHGAPYIVAPKEQTHVPMIFWANQGFYQAKSLDAQCLAQLKQNEFSHDYIFSSLIGIMDVSTTEYKPELDLFASCRKK